MAAAVKLQLTRPQQLQPEWNLPPGGAGAPLPELAKDTVVEVRSGDKTRVEGGKGVQDRKKGGGERVRWKAGDQQSESACMPKDTRRRWMRVQTRSCTTQH